MCCQENDKSSPSRHLSLPLAARIFSSTHCYPSFRSLFLFSSISLSVSRLLFTLLRRLFPPFQLPLPNISFCLPCPPFCSLVDNFFPPFHAYFLLSSSVPPCPVLIFKPPPCFASSSSYYSHHFPHYVHTIYRSVTLFVLFPPLFCFPCVSSSMSFPQCVVIIARLATAADSQAVGTDREREREGGEMG